MNEPERTLRGSLECVEWSSGSGDVEALVVLMHGFGAAGDDLVGLAPAIAGERNTRFVFPAAPLTPPDMASWGGRAWWPLRLAELMPKLASGEVEALTVVEPEGLADARDAVKRAIDAVQVDFPADRLLLGGFSQGAMLAADVAVRAGVSPSALLLLSGAPLFSDDWPEREPLDVPAFVSHGRFDEVLPFACGELLRDRLQRSLDCDVHFNPFDAGHTIPQEIVSLLRGFVASV